MGFQCSFEVRRLNPVYIVFLTKDVVIFLGFRHIDAHVIGNFYQTITAHSVFLIIVVGKDVVDVLILNKGVRQIVLVTNGQWQLFLNGIDEHGIA